MTHSTTTANYGLPQFADNDKPTWRIDVNETNQKIDAALAELAEAVSAPSGIEPVVTGILTTAMAVVTGGTGLTAKQLDELTLYTEGN